MLSDVVWLHGDMRYLSVHGQPYDSPRALADLHTPRSCGHRTLVMITKVLYSGRCRTCADVWFAPSRQKGLDIRSYAGTVLLASSVCT